MPMATATLTSKGQVTIPREVRTSLGVGAGDRLDFVKLDDGNYAIVPASHSIRSLKGVLGGPRKAVSLDEMQAAIESGARGE
jgi:AbrB family looped-hinge helix DNA binding protein